MNIEQRVDAAVEELLPDLLSYTQKIVSFPSTAGQEREAQQYVSAMLQERGFTVDMWDPDVRKLREDYPFFTGSRPTFQGSPNVVGTRAGSGGGRSLLVDGHVDVVPAENAGEWSTPPFAGTIQGNRIVGRGVSDMKCTHALLFFCMDVLEKLRLRLKGDLLFASVIDEETGGAGTLACAQRGYHADAALLPEPVSMAVCPAGQGVSYFKIFVKGKAFHGGARYYGVSAIEKAMDVVKAVNQLEEARTARLAHPLYRDLPTPFTINIGTIRGGEWPSMVAGEVVLEGRFGVAPQESILEARADLENCLLRLGETDPWFKEHPPRVEWTANFLQSGEIPAEHPFVQTLAADYEAVCGKQPQISGTPFGTDAGTLIRLANTPAVVFGPGSCAHNVDEWMDIDTLKTYARIFIRTVIHWCGVEEMP